MMFARLLSFWGPANFQGRAVKFPGCTIYGKMTAGHLTNWVMKIDDIETNGGCHEVAFCQPGWVVMLGNLGIQQCTNSYP